MTHFTLVDYLIASGSGVAAGLINAIAGGGTLVSFPALVAIGVSPVAANITNIIALVPGYFSGTYAQRSDLAQESGRLRHLASFAAAGGLLGSVLLVNVSANLFRNVVPFLILVCCALLLAQNKLRALVGAHTGAGEADGQSSLGLRLGIFLCCIYGGFFGAGLGIMLLAVLGLFVDATLPRLNAVKQALSVIVGVLAGSFLLFSPHVVWSLAAALAVSSLIGGIVGGRLVHRVNARALRVVVVIFGTLVAFRYWL